MIRGILKLSCISTFNIYSTKNTSLLTWVLNSVGWVRLARVRECETSAVGVESLEMPEKQHSFSKCDRNQSLFNVWKGRRGLFALFEWNDPQSKLIIYDLRERSEWGVVLCLQINGNNVYERS